MSTTTHYTALGLVPTAAPEVIRAAYKALALVCHPDKTIHLTTSERASHAAAFNEVQAAYDVLGKPSLKAAYDARLSFQMDNVDRYHSASRGPFQARNASEASSTPKHSATVKLTTPEERTAMRAKARQSLDVLRQKRTERDTHEAQLGVVDLRGLVQTWTQLAEENRADPAMHAHCAIRIHEYEQKIAERERQHEEWLINMSTAKQETTTPTSKPRHTTRDAPKTSTPLRSTGSIPSSSASHSSVCRPSPMSTTPTPQARIGRVEERKRAEAERSAAAAARTETRSLEKAQRDAVKQALMEQKAAVVRAEKVKQKEKLALQAREADKRIAKARAKAGAAPVGTAGAMVGGPSTGDSPVFSTIMNRAAPMAVQTKVKKICEKCGIEHASFRDWRICNA